MNLESHTPPEAWISMHLWMHILPVMLLTVGQGLYFWSNWRCNLYLGCSKKQTTVALSTCESEYYAMAMAAQETILLSRVLKEAGLEIEGAIPIRSES